MQIVSRGDNLLEMSNPIFFWGEKIENISKMSPAEFFTQHAKR